MVVRLIFVSRLIVLAFALFISVRNSSCFLIVGIKLGFFSVSFFSDAMSNDKYYVFAPPLPTLRFYGRRFAVTREVGRLCMILLRIFSGILDV